MGALVLTLVFLLAIVGYLLAVAAFGIPHKNDWYE